MRPDFKFCAIHYMEQWFCKEEALRLSLRNPDSESRLVGLAHAARFFAVARTLPRRFDVEIGVRRYEPLLEVMDEIKDRQIDSESPEEIVEVFRSELSARYGGKDVLSLATKVLWLLFRDPIIIYDSRVRSALASPVADFPTYVERWLSHYDVHRSSIREACATLPELHQYIECGSRLSREDVLAVCNEDWFQKRVLDIYLWHQGGSDA